MLAHVRRWSVLAVLLASTATATPALAATPAPPAPTQGGEQQDAATDGQDLVSFGIAPAGAERPDGRPYLSFSAAPGSTIYDHVAVLNQADQPLSLEVYSGDVIQADAGLSVLPRDDDNVDAGSWITVDGPGDLEVPAQTPDTGVGYVIVPFTVTIPANAEPGDHLGGIVASLVTTGEGGDNSPTIRLDQRVAARVYIRVDGELAPGLVVRDLTADWQAGSLIGTGSVAVTYTLQNTGNVRMAVEPTARVAGPYGLLSRSTAGDRVDDLLPGASVEQSVTVDDVWPLGRERVTVSAPTLASSVGEDPGLGTITASTHVWALPWIVVAVVLLLVVLGVLRLVRRRRRRAGRGRDAGGRRARRRGGRGPDVRAVPAGPAGEIAAPAQEQPVTAVARTRAGARHR
ncbi:COG1470 family protein [Cellulomonas hominis]